MDLTTLVRVKAMAGIDVLDEQHDTILNRLISAYSADFEKRLDRHTLVGARTEVHNVRTGKRTLSLRAAPASVAPTSVKYSHSRDFSGSTALTENLEYTVDLEQALIRFLFATSLPVGYAQVIYTGGMAATTAAFISGYPAIAEACDLQVIYHWRRRDYVNGSRVVEGGSSNYIGELNLLKAVERVLDQYMRRYV
jgi:hypothetical protein